MSRHPLRGILRPLGLRRRFGIACLIVFVCLSNVSEAQQRFQPFAQPGGRQFSSATRSVFLPVPRELQRELDRAIEDIKNERYVDAVTRLDLILQGGNDEDVTELTEDYFLPIKKSNESFRSLKFEAERIIGSMPPKGLEAYELAHGTDARQQLKAAIAKGDYDMIAEISRRYAHTIAGQEATMLLGRERLIDGRFLEAVLQFRRLNESETARKRFGAELPLLLGTSLQLGGRGNLAAEVLNEFRKENPDASVRVGGNEIRWFTEANQANAWLASMVGDVAPGFAKATDEWYVYGGNAQRSGNTTAGMPIGSRRWPRKFTNDRRVQEQLDRQAKTVQENVAIPVLQPLAIGDWLIMRMANKLIGVNAETGVSEWHWPWDQDVGKSQYGPDGARFVPLVKKRVWSDVLYGQLSSDGKAVFFLDELNGDYRTQTTGAQLTNTLVALEFERQGSLMWLVGGATGRDDENLAGVFFLGPPLPINDKLYCVAEQNGEIRLLVLSKADGKLVWSQQLAQVDSSPRGNLSDQRRLAGVNLSYENGIIVCPTSVGGVVAVDVDRRSLLWGYQYSEPSRSRQYTSSRTIAGKGWRDNVAVISDGKVVLLPWDGQNIECLDLVTGKRMWDKPRPRSNVIYCAGVHDNKAVFVGKNDVTAVNLKTGNTAWNLVLPGGPSGTGIKSGSEYMLATNASEVVRIDLNTGSIVDSIPTEEPLGNLIVAKDQIVSQNYRTLRAFYQKSKLQERVDTLLAKNADDPWALEHQGVLLLEEGKREAGLVALRRAISFYPAGEDDSSSGAKQLMIRTVLEMLRNNDPNATELAIEIGPLIESAETKNEFDRMMAVNLRRLGKPIAAFERNISLFQNLLASKFRTIELKNNGSLMSVGRARKILHERWHRALFRDLWKQGSDSEREQMTRLVTKTIAEADDATKAAYASVMTDLPPVHGLVLDLLRKQIDDGQVDGITESRLLRLSQAEEASIAGRASALLAKLYRDAGKYAAAAEIFWRLETEFENEVVIDDLTGSEFVSDAVSESETVRQFVEKAVPWNFGEIKVSKLTSTRPPTNRINATQPFDTLGRLTEIDQEIPGVQLPAGLQLVFDNSPTLRNLHGRDAMGNVQPIATLTGSLGSRVTGRALRVRTNGHLIVCAEGESLVAINALEAKTGGEEAVLWHEAGATPATGYGYAGSLSTLRPINFGKELNGVDLGLKRSIESGRSGRSPTSLGPVTADGVVLRRYGDLICLDPLAGETVWSRNDVDMSADVWGDSEYVFVSSNGTAARKNARVFSTLDGSELPSRRIPSQSHRVRMFGRYALTWHYDVVGSIPDDKDMVKIVSEIIRPDRDVKSIPEKVQDLVVHRFEVVDLLDPRKTLWQRTCGIKSKATFVGDHELAIYDPTLNRFQVISVLDGELIIDVELKASLKKIDRFEVEQRAGLYIVTLAENSSGKNPVDGKIRFKSPLGAAARLANLEVHAFGPTGQMVWGVPAKLQDFVQLNHFAGDVPLLVYIRNDETMSGATRGKRQLQTVVLDARDGHVVHTDSSPLNSSRVIHVRGDRLLQEARLRVPSSNGAWKLQFTEDPRSPSPPYGYATAKVREGGSSIFSIPFNIIRSLTPKMPVTPEDGPVDDGDDLNDLFR